MKIKNSIPSRVVSIFSSVLIAYMLMFSSMASAHCECVHFSAAANIQFTGDLIPGPEPIAIGEVTYEFGHSTRQAAVTGFLLEAPKFLEDGSINLNINVFHDFSGGDTITWNLGMVLTPTEIPGEFRLDEKTNIVDGSGVFAGAFSRGTGQGTASFNTFQAQVFVNDTMCGVDLSKRRKHHFSGRKTHK